MSKGNPLTDPRMKQVASTRDRFSHAHDVRTPLKLPVGVQCYAIAATKAPDAGGKRLGDGLVPLDSALGRHAKPELMLGFPDAHQWIARGMGHLDLLSRAEVYATIRPWLSSPPGHRCRTRRRAAAT